MRELFRAPAFSASAKEELVSARGRAKAQPAAFFSSHAVPRPSELSRNDRAGQEGARSRPRRGNFAPNAQHDADPSILNPPRHTPGHTLGDRNITVREDKAPTKSAPSKSGGNRSTIGDKPAADGCRCYVGNLAWETNEESLIGEFQPDTPDRADSGRSRAPHRGCGTSPERPVPDV